MCESDYPIIAFLRRVFVYIIIMCDISLIFESSHVCICVSCALTILFPFPRSLPAVRGVSILLQMYNRTTISAWLVLVRSACARPPSSCMIPLRRQYTYTKPAPPLILLLTIPHIVPFSSAISSYKLRYPV